MSYTVQHPISKNSLTKTQQSFLDKLVTITKEITEITSTSEYNSFVRNVLTLAKKQYRVHLNTPLHDRELHDIVQEKPLTEKTLWGGVALKKVDVDKDFIEKLLVVRQHGVLGFEIHNYKKEQLEIVEGVCIIVHVDHAKMDTEMTLTFATKGDIFQFAPGDEHGVISLTNCVIKETSTNHLDDLVYIFKASQL